MVFTAVQHFVVSFYNCDNGLQFSGFWLTFFYTNQENHQNMFDPGVWILSFLFTTASVKSFIIVLFPTGDIGESGRTAGQFDTDPPRHW